MSQETYLLKECTLTATQEKYVRANYNHMAITEMASNLGLNCMKVARNMAFLGLKATVRGRVATKVKDFDNAGFFNLGAYAKIATI